MKGDKWMEIRNDYKKGLSYTEIGRKYCIDPRTAKKYAHSDLKPVYKLKKPKTSKLDKYKQQIDMWLEEAPFSAVRIKEKLDEIGSDCGYTIIKDYVREKKNDLNNKATVRFETVPGLQAQVDWGFFENYRVVENGIEKSFTVF